MKSHWIFPLSIALLYAAFWRWYSGTGKPLTPQEINAHLRALETRGAKPDVLRRLRAFLEADSGRGFVMVNLLHLRPEAQAGGSSPSAAFGRYNRAFLPTLFKRAGHPLWYGKAAGQAVEVWGIEDGAQWSAAGLVRYRSRRDMIEAAADPRFAEMHPDKVAALEKTIAIPVEPQINPADPRLLLGLVALIAALFTWRSR